jgi:phosphonate transport system substrate-binding protein
MTHAIQRRDFSVAVLSGSLMPEAALAQAMVPLEMGLLPNVSARTLLSRYQPLRDYLALVLQRPVQLSTASDWSVFHQRMGVSTYDLVVTAPHMARLAQVDHGWQPLVQMLPDTQCLLVFAASRPVASLAQLRGKTVVLSNPQSLVALLGTHWLAAQGLRQSQEITVMRTPTDDGAGAVLLRGDALAALISDGELRATPQTIREQLRTLTVFATVPGFMILASARTDAEAVRRIKRHLLAFGESLSAEAAAFMAATGVTGMREIAPGTLPSLDIYLQATREKLVQAS